MRWMVICLSVWACPAPAQDPPAAFYVGLYRVIGVDDAGPVDQIVRIDAQGENLIVSMCGVLATMVLPHAAGDEHYINAVIGGKSLTCDPFSTYDNYPLLACYGDGDSIARLTLWPADSFSDPLNCVGE
jgi:hypothetical protein